MPGIGYVIILGLQSESTIAIVGIPNLAESIIAWNKMKCYWKGLLANFCILLISHEESVTTI